ncbi:STAS domain-containing protein [Nonomuraea sp. 3-1Str]|uniref:STAS domain-containing protein n=1 Tax=unclassified Nonomuraea TaxID=2593643 RepID=UPI0028620912|nr:STAS domain-containing protein [Nonomuraea sp. 3-1Str]MDR8408498.1 STAS domain-containing protein [Nonomuraea sp. 3-1Str]
MVVKYWREDLCTVVRVVGDLDVAGAPRLRAELDHILTRTDSSNVVIDLTAVPFCDSVGLGVLVSAFNHVHHVHGRLILVLADGMISHLLTITNLDRHFETASSVEEACSAVSAAA